MEIPMWTEEIERMALQIFKGLLRIDTSNPPGDETQAVRFLQGVLAAEGLESMCLEGKEGRGNLRAHLPGGSQRPIILLSHLDVVDAMAEDWEEPPFGAVEKDGVIWGRGALDTKQLTVMELIAFILLHRSGKSLDRDLYLLATADEEQGSTWGLEYLQKQYPQYLPDALILNEGGGFPLLAGERVFMPVATGEKGACSIRIQAQGPGGHASVPPPDQAMGKLAKAMGLLCTHPPLPRTSPIGDYFYQITSGEEQGLIGDLHQYMTNHSVQVHNISAGHTPNAIPSKVEAILDFRLLPSVKKEEVLEYIEEVLGEEDVVWNMESFQPGYQSDWDHPFFHLLTKKARELASEDIEPLPFLALGRTDGRFFGPRGGDVYGFSPLLSDTPFTDVLKKVHKENESLSVPSFLYGCKVLYSTLFDFCVCE